VSTPNHPSARGPGARQKAAPIERTIACLEPLLTAARRARMQAVLAGRSDHVAFVFERMIDPHNLSAALRSLDAFSFQDVYLVQPGERLAWRRPCERDADQAPAGMAEEPPEGVLARGITIGAERWLSLHEEPSSSDCLTALRAAGYVVLASHLGPKAQPLPAIDFSRRTALVFGNEHLGVSAEVLARADGAFRIDMLGFAQSLNLSVAVAISAFHARQALTRLAAQDERPDRFALPPQRQRRLYAEWLRGSVKHAERILAAAQASRAAKVSAGV
jgi:tRNA (guanosine-2'-O-)-methyltransferase